MTTDQVTSKFDKLSNAKKVEVLFDAIDYMQQYNGRTISTCICLAMGYEGNYDENDNFVWKKSKKTKKMNNEYVIVNKSLLEKRIEELEKELAYHNEWYEKAREKYHQDRKSWGNADDGEMRVASDAVSTTAQEIKVLKQILSQSTPLIPEINAAIEFGKDIIGSNMFISTDENGTPFIDYFDTTTETNHYISNLKLDI